MTFTKKLFTSLYMLALPLTGFGNELYFGGSLGQSRSEDASASELSYFAYTNVTSEASDTEDFAYSVFFGYTFDFTDFSLATEVGYVDFGENTLVAEGNDFAVAGDGTRTVNFSAEAESLSVSLIALKELQDDFSVFGRLGVSQWDVSGQLNGQVFNSSGAQTGFTSQSASEDGTDLYLGFGLEYKFIRVGFDRYEVNDSTTNYLYAGVKF